MNILDMLDIKIETTPTTIVVPIERADSTMFQVDLSLAMDNWEIKKSFVFEHYEEYSERETYYTWKAVMAALYEELKAETHVDVKDAEFLIGLATLVSNPICRHVGLIL